MSWLKKLTSRPLPPDIPVDYPDGLAVSVGNDVYYIKRGKRFKFFSQRTFDSWNLTAVEGSEQSLSNIPSSKGYMGFRDGSLITNFATGTLYLISNSKRRRITNPDALERLGIYNWNPIVASEAEIMLHTEGADIE